MARQQGSHVEYDPEKLRRDETGIDRPTPTIVRVFGSKIRALESAVENTNRWIFLLHGETLEEALARKASEADAPAGRRSSTKAPEAATS
jgi:hypothetical protein